LPDKCQTKKRKPVKLRESTVRRVSEVRGQARTIITQKQQNWHCIRPAEQNQAAPAMAGTKEVKLPDDVVRPAKLMQFHDECA